MSVTKIPSTLLQSFECAECGHYLSSSPIGIRQDKTNVCHMCFDEETTRNNVFETIAALHMFPCNYRAHGCTEYLPFNNVTHHEDNCFHRAHSCPVNLFSYCNWIGAVKEIYPHYKKHHSSLRLKDPSFKINLAHKEQKGYNYIISISHVDVILIAEYLCNTQILSFNAIYLGDVQSANSIKYYIQLSSDNQCTRVMKLEESTLLPLTKLHQNNIEVDVNNLQGFLQNATMIHTKWSFIIPDHLKKPKTVNIKTKSFKCPICKLSMVPPIHRCAIGHVLCNDCKEYKMFCQLCQHANSKFSRAVDLEDEAIDFTYYCRWKDCMRCFNCFLIKQHEQECSKRIYNCPICLKSIGRFNMIIKHFSSEHAHVKYLLSNNNFVKLNKKTDYSYVFVSREIFKVTIIEDVDYKWTIDIFYYGTPSLNNWRYEIVRNCNIIHYASKVSNNQYRLEHDEFSNKAHMQCYFAIRFIKQQTSLMWMPYEPPKRKTCTIIDY